MPGIPLTPNGTSYARAADQMCRHDSHEHLSAEEEIAAEESLSIYCKPVELYNILQRRAAKNPSFLQRCLQYKLQAKHKKRIQMTISLPATLNGGSHIQSMFPLCILLARQVPIPVASEYSAVYCFKRACMLSSCSGVDKTNQAYAKFVLPEMNKLSSEIDAASLVILFISCAEIAKDCMDMSYFASNVEGHCLLSRMSMELPYLSLEKSPNLGLGERAEMFSTVDLCPCFMKVSYLENHGCVSFQFPQSFGAADTSHEIKVSVAAEEVGAKERTSYDSYSYNEVPNSSLHHIKRLRTGNVVFNYRYYNNKCQRTEVTEDFTCPFCLVKCGSFKGLRYHLSSCHDLFCFDFWVTEEYQAVNVSVKTDVWRSEIIADGVDPKQQTFFFCSRPLRRRKQQNVQNGKHVHPLAFDSDSPTTIKDLHIKNDGIMECDASSPNAATVSSATGQPYPDPDCTESLPGSSLAPPAVLQFAKTRKLSVERSDPRNRTLLQKRQFFHSHRAQPMELEQVLSDQDSEDEVDDDVADLEDRRMLDDFVDVSKDEKHMMHLWNSFVRKQRVLADGHIPWACEAFSKQHGQDFLRTPALLWCWRLFMIKLWNHGLLDARAMNNCNVILEQFQNQDEDKS